MKVHGIYLSSCAVGSAQDRINICLLLGQNNSVAAISGPQLVTIQHLHIYTNNAYPPTSRISFLCGFYLAVV